jgi:16S rRNA (cytosine967-C5)-methyltransferase
MSRDCVNTSLEPAALERDLLARLAGLYGDRTERVVEALSSMGSRYYFRTNSLTCHRERVLEEISLSLARALPHEELNDVAWFGVEERQVSPRGTGVVADKFAAEAVLQGAHLYARGVKNCSGLKLGAEASVMHENGEVAGVGVARQGETSILNYHQGLAVEVHETRFGLPSLMNTEWYVKGQIHLQSLPAIVACRVLDPQPGELIVDLNCAPGGKMSYISQLTANRARVVGFDRNKRKLQKTRTQLERMDCANYNLVNHDSRYAHLDYKFKPDRVLVDPPCTGLGVTPKLSVDTTATNVDDLSSYQKQFLRAASHLVKPGGVIVYSVCTITREECEDIARFGTDELELELECAEPMIGCKGADPDGLTQRFDPDTHGSGFFIARFRKN